MADKTSRKVGGNDLSSVLNRLDNMANMIANLAGESFESNIEEQVADGITKGITNGAKKAKSVSQDISDKIEIDGSKISDKVADVTDKEIQKGIEKSQSKSKKSKIEIPIQDIYRTDAVKKQVNEYYRTVVQTVKKVNKDLKELKGPEVESFLNAYGALKKLKVKIPAEAQEIRNNIAGYADISDQDRHKFFDKKIKEKGYRIRGAEEQVFKRDKFEEAGVQQIEALIESTRKSLEKQARAAQKAGQETANAHKQATKAAQEHLEVEEKITSAQKKTTPASEKSSVFHKAVDLKDLKDQYKLLRRINQDIKEFENPDNWIPAGNGAKTFNGVLHGNNGLEELKQFKKEILELNPILKAVGDSTESISRKDFVNMFGAEFGVDAGLAKKANDVKDLIDQYTELVNLNNRIDDINPESSLAERARKERDEILKLNPLLEEYADHREIIATPKELQSKWNEAAEIKKVTTNIDELEEELKEVGQQSEISNEKFANSQDDIQTKINETVQLLEKEREEVKKLESILNGDVSFKGKKEATDSLRYWNKVINDADSEGVRPSDKAILAYMNVRSAAEKLGVAQSSLDKYFNPTAIGRYDEALSNVNNTYRVQLQSIDLLERKLSELQARQNGDDNLLLGTQKDITIVDRLGNELQETGQQGETAGDHIAKGIQEAREEAERTVLSFDKVAEAVRKVSEEFVNSRRYSLGARDLSLDDVTWDGGTYSPKKNRPDPGLVRGIREDDLFSNIRNQYSLYTKMQTAFKKGNINESELQDAANEFKNVVVSNFVAAFRRNADKSLLYDVQNNLPKKIFPVIEEYIQDAQTFIHEYNEFAEKFRQLKDSNGLNSQVKLIELGKGINTRENQISEDSLFAEAVPKFEDASDDLTRYLATNYSNLSDFETTLKDVCKILGIEIPKTTERASEAIREIGNENVLSSGTQEAVQQQNILQGELEETAEETRKAKEEAKELLTFYRGIDPRAILGDHPGESGIYKAGSVSETPWYSSSLDIAKEYADKLGEIYEIQLALDKVMTIDAQGAHWNNILYLGEGEEEESKKLLALYDTLTKAKKRLTDDFKWDGTSKQAAELYTKGSKEAKQASMDYQQAKIKFDNAIRESEKYGYTATDDLAKMAKELGYQAIIIKNVMDSEGGKIADNMSLLTGNMTGVETAKLLDINGNLIESYQKEATTAQEAAQEVTKLGEARKETSRQSNETPDLFEDSTGQLSFIQNLTQAEEKLGDAAEETGNKVRKANDQIEGQMSFDDLAVQQERLSSALEEQNAVLEKNSEEKRENAQANTTTSDEVAQQERVTAAYEEATEAIREQHVEKEKETDTSATETAQKVEKEAESFAEAEVEAKKLSVTKEDVKNANQELASAADKTADSVDKEKGAIEGAGKAGDKITHNGVKPFLDPEEDHVEWEWVTKKAESYIGELKEIATIKRSAVGKNVSYDITGSNGNKITVAKNSEGQWVKTSQVIRDNTEELKENAKAAREAAKAAEEDARWEAERGDREAYIRGMNQVAEDAEREAEYIRLRNQYLAEGARQAEEYAKVQRENQAWENEAKDREALVNGMKQVAEDAEREAEYQRLRNQYLAEGAAQAEEIRKEYAQIRAEEEAANKERIKNNQDVYKQYQGNQKQANTTSEKELNNLLEQRADAYKEIWDINTKIAGLDENKDKGQIAELEKQKEAAKELFNSIQKQLSASKEYYQIENRLADLKKIQADAQDEIATNEAKERDKLTNKLSGYEDTLKELSESGKYAGELGDKISEAANKAKELRNQLEDANIPIQTLRNSMGSFADSFNDITVIQKQVDNLVKSIQSTINKKGAQGVDSDAIATLNDFITKLRQVGDQAGFDKLKGKYEAFIATVKTGGKELENSFNIDKTLKKLDKDFLGSSALKKFMPELIASAKELKEKLQSFKDSKIDFNTEEGREKIKKLQEDLNELYDSKKLDKFKKASDTAWSNMGAKIESYMERNSAMGRKFQQQFENLRIEWNSEKSVEELKKVAIEYNNLEMQINKAGKTGASFFDTLRQRAMGVNAQLIAQYLSWQDMIRYARQAAEAVISVDTALTELRKVSGASTERLQQSFEASTKTAKELGRTISDVINSTADWSRAGFSVDQAEELARVSTLYQNVGDNIDAATANEHLVSTLRGFHMAAEDAERIVDSINEVSNNFSIDTAGIGEGLQRSASVFYNASTDLNSAIALITGAKIYWYKIWKHIFRTFLIAGKSLEPYTTIMRKLHYEGLIT